MMYSVYKSALLNISADDSNDARWGCFRNRDPLAVLPMRLHLPPATAQGEGAGEEEDSPSQGQEKGHYWLTPDSTGLFEAITKAPLARRAWVFQERQLSRRVLHFTGREVVWECCAEGSHFACETFPRGAPLPVLFGGRPKYQGQGLLLSGGGGAGEQEREREQAIYDTWDMLCRSYSEKRLSHAGDKTVALSGLAREFQALLPRDVYAAGTWRSLLPQALLWKSADSSGRIDSGSYIAPSWSWLSIDGPISEFPLRGNLLPVVEVLNVTTEPVVPSETTASLREAYLDLECYLRPVEVRPDHEAKPWYMMAIGGGKDHKLVVGDGGEELGSFDPPSDSDTFRYSFDVPFTENSGPTSVSAYFLPVSVDDPDETSSTSINGLLVEPVDNDLTMFRRVGIMSCHGKHCLSILYRARAVEDLNGENADSTGQWSKLRSLLGESYEAWEIIRRRQKDAMDSPSDPVGDNSPRPGSDGPEEEQQPGTTSKVPDDAVETSLDAKEAEAESETNQTISLTDVKVDKVEEGIERLHVSEEEEDSNPSEPPVPTTNWEAFAPLDRLYAADGAFPGSELEQHFEKMVARRIRLV